MFFGRREDAQSCSVGSVPSSFDIELFPKPADVLRLVVDDRQHSAEEQEIAGLHRLDVRAERSRRGRELNAKLLQAAIRAARLRTLSAYHRPACAPPSTCSTSPVTLRASARYTTASAMSFESEIVPIGESVFRKSFGFFSCKGVSTTPGATALKRISFFAYSPARLRVIALSPPFVIIATDAGTPAIGLSASDAVMVVTLPPVTCESICLTANWVIKMKPSRLVETSLRKSSAVYSVNGLATKMPALLTT